VIRIGEIETTLALTSNRNTLRKNTYSYIVYLSSVLWLLVNINVVSSWPILLTVMMEAIRSSETSVLTRATRRNVPEDGIFHVHFVKTLDLTKLHLCLQHWYQFDIMNSLKESCVLCRALKPRTG
jgi:hypothetical protein